MADYPKYLLAKECLTLRELLMVIPLFQYDQLEWLVKFHKTFVDIHEDHTIYRQWYIYDKERKNFEKDVRYKVGEYY